MAEIPMADLRRLQAEAVRGRKQKPVSIPLQWNETVKLANVTPFAIHKRLRNGRDSNSGRIVTLEWRLIQSDATAAIYQAECPYEYCGGTGTLEAMALIDSRGKAELPFADPGAVCCLVCDEAISKLYEAEAARMKKPETVS